MVSQVKVQDFGVVVKEVDWRNKSVVDCIAEL